MLRCTYRCVRSSFSDVGGSQEDGGGGGCGDYLSSGRRGGVWWLMRVAEGPALRIVEAMLPV